MGAIWPLCLALGDRARSELNRSKQHEEPDLDVGPCLNIWSLVDVSGLPLGLV
jgi:hypothetical protein